MNGWEAPLLRSMFDEIARRSADSAGVSRPAYSALETATLAYIEARAREEGLAARYDAGRNLVLSLPEHADARRFVLVGSHVDSVPQGGNYDGLSGVLAGLLCLVRARRAGLAFPQPVKVIAMRGEESSWFGPCYIGSKALLGQLQPEEATAPHKGDGRPLLDHMRDLGLDVERIAQREPLLDAGCVLAYLELHIEQGPLLVRKRLPAAVVSGIRGNFRHKRIACIGEAGHSGAVPRAYRHDPVLATASLLNDLDARWQEILQRGDDLAVTVGTLATDPEASALSRIPDRIDFSLDVRSQDERVLDEVRHWIEGAAVAVARQRQVEFRFDSELQTAPAHCHPAIVERLARSQAEAGQEPLIMASGGGHDAAVFANAGIPTGMVFVRNEHGSHNPDEAMEIEDLLAGVDILQGFLASDFPQVIR